jgi:phosphoglycolate phosphatase
VLTNKPTSPTKKLLDAFRIADLFESVIGGDGPYPRKPSPDGLLAMMASTGATRERTLMVGDSNIDYETAQRASVRCCVVSYGFGFRTFSARQGARRELGCRRRRGIE